MPHSSILPPATIYNSSHIRLYYYLPQKYTILKNNRSTLNPNRPTIIYQGTTKELPTNYPPSPNHPKCTIFKIPPPPKKILSGCAGVPACLTSITAITAITSIDAISPQRRPATPLFIPTSREPVGAEHPRNKKLMNN